MTKEWGQQTNDAERRQGQLFKKVYMVRKTERENKHRHSELGLCMWVCVNVSVSMSSWETMGSPFLVHYVRDRTDSQTRSSHTLCLNALREHPYFTSMVCSGPPCQLLRAVPFWSRQVGKPVWKPNIFSHIVWCHYWIYYPHHSTWIIQKVLLIIDNDCFKYVGFSATQQELIKKQITSWKQETWGTKEIKDLCSSANKPSCSEVNWQK